MTHKILAEKYLQVIKESAVEDFSTKLANVKNLIQQSANRELTASFNELLLALLNSTDENVKQAANSSLNTQTQVAKEEDEFLVTPNGDSADPNRETDSSGVGF